jgi:hypothetical protein
MFTSTGSRPCHESNKHDSAKRFRNNPTSATIQCALVNTRWAASRLYTLTSWFGSRTLQFVSCSLRLPPPGGLLLTRIAQSTRRRSILTQKTTLKPLFIWFRAQAQLWYTAFCLHRNRNLKISSMCWIFATSDKSITGLCSVALLIFELQSIHSGNVLAFACPTGTPAFFGDHDGYHAREIRCALILYGIHAHTYALLTVVAALFLELQQQEVGITAVHKEQQILWLLSLEFGVHSCINDT